MKKIRKILFMTFGLLMICLTLALVNYNVNYQNPNNDQSNEVSSTTLPDYLKVDGFLGGIRAVYTTSEFFEGDASPTYVTELSDIVPNADGSRTFYITFYLVIEKSVNGYTFEFDVSPYNGKLEFLNLSTKIQELYDKVDNEEASSDEEDYYDTYYKPIRKDSAFRKFNVTNTCEGGYLIFTGYQSSATPVENTTGKATYDLFLDKVKVTLPSDVTEFSLTCTSTDRGDGGDNPSGITTSVTDPETLESLKLTLGSGTASDLTTTTGTWTGGSSYDTVSFVADHTAHTLSAIIPAEWPTEYVSYNFIVDGGKGSYTISGDSNLDSMNSKIKIPAKGSSITATLTATAAAGNTQNYTVNLTRRSSDLSALKLSGNGTEAYSLTDFDYDANNHTYTMKSGTQIKWDNTAVNLAVTLPSTSTQTLKINNTSASSGSNVSCNLGASSTADTSHSFEFVITEYGHSTTYKVEFERAKGSSNVDIKGINVWIDNESNPLNITGPVIDGSGKYVYTITDSVKNSVSSLNFKVNLNSTSTQTITIDGSTWNGTAAKTIDTAGVDNSINGYEFSKNFTVNPQVGESRTYVIVGIRDYKKNDNTDIAGTWKGNASTKNVALTVDHNALTITGILPANFTSSSVTVSLSTDGGNGTNTLTPITGTWNGYTLTTLPNPGSSVSAKVKSVAQDGEHSVEYTLTLTRRSSDYSNVTLTGNSTETFTLTSSQYDAVNKTYELPSTTAKLAWDNTIAGLAVTLADATNQKLTINGQVATSGTKVNKSLAVVSSLDTPCEIEFAIEEIDGSTNTYTVKFTRAAGSSDTGIDGIVVWYSSESSPFAISGPSASNVFTFDDEVPYDNTTLNFKVNLKNKDTQTITKVDNISVTWKGDTSRTFSTGSLGNTVNQSFTVTFVVTPQVGLPVTYTISGEREFKKNNSTAIEGTWKGENDPAAVNFTINHDTKKITGTIPADYSSTYITVTLVTDNGSGSNTITGTTGTWATNVVDTPNLGQSVTATVKSMSQAYDSSKSDSANAGLFANYTLTLTRRNEDYTNLTFVTKDKNGNVLQNLPLSYNDSTNTYTLPAGTTAPWDATNADVTLTLASPSTQTLKIDNQSSTSGIATNCSLGASSTSKENKTITITITENGITNTYYIKFDRDGGDGSTKLTNPGVKVWFDNEASPFNVSYQGLNYDNYYEYKITDPIPYKNISLQFKVYLEDTSTQVITYLGDKWDGTSPKTLSTGNLGNTINYPFAVTFVVSPQVGNSVTYVITGTRNAAADEKGISGNLIGTTLQDDNNYSTYAFGAGSQQSNVITYPITVAEDKVRFDIRVHETSTLYFGEGLEPTTLYSSIPATTEYEVGSYDSAKVYTAKVVTEAGNSYYHKFELKRFDDRSQDTTLKALTLKVDGALLIPQVSATDLTPLNPTFSSSILTYYYTIPYKYENATTISVTATPNDDQAKGVFDSNQTDYAVSSITIADLKEKSTNMTNEFYFYVKSEAGSFGNPYRVVIIRTDGRDDAYLSNVQVSSPLSAATSVPTGTNDASGSIYPAFVSIDAQTATITFDVAPGATANIDKTQNINIIGNKGTLTVSVTSEKGTTKNYTIAVYATEQGADIKNIRILDYNQSYDAVNSQLYPTLYDLVDANGDIFYSFNINDYQSPIEITVPYSVAKIYMHAISNKSYVSYNDTGVIDLQPGVTKILSVYSTSHYSSLNPQVTEKSNVYTFKIYREKASEENRIKSITAYYGLVPSNSTLIDDVNIDFNRDLPGITISNFDLENYTEATLYIELMDPDKSTLKVDGNAIAPNASGICVVKLSSLTFTAGKASKTLYVYPELGDPMEYVLTISSTEKVDPVMPTITGISINGPKANKDYLNGVILDPSEKIPVKLDKNETGVTVSVSISGLEGSYAIEYIEVGQTESTKVASKSAFVPTAVGTTIVKVYPFTTKENGTVYTFELVREQASSINTIGDVNIGGESGTPTPNGDTIFDVPSGTNSVPVTITPDDPKSTINVKLPDGTTFIPTSYDPDTGVISGTIPGLNPGDNTITITVKPEDDSKPENTYTIKVVVDQPTELKSLIVKNLDESKTYDMSGTSPVYTVDVPYDQDYVKVIYELPDGVDATKINVVGAGLASSPLTVPVPNSFDHKVIVSTIAGATDSKEYTIKFVKAQPKVGNDLIKVEITIPDNDGDGNPEVIQVPGFASSKTSYDIALPANTSSYQFTNIEVSEGATPIVDADKTLTNNAKNSRKITVKPQSGIEKIYLFNMYVANTECEITSIKVLNINGTELVDLDNNSLIFNAVTDEYKLRVANTVSTIKLEIKYSVTAKLNYSYGSENVSYTGGTAKVTVSLDNVGSTNPNEIVVQALSQLYELNNTLGATDISSPYNIIITREDLDDDYTLSRLELYVSNIDKIENFSSNLFTYIVDDLGNIATVRLVAETTSAKAKITSISTVSSSAVGQRIFDGSIALEGILKTDFTALIVVTVTAENGDNKDYQIMISRGNIDPDKDNTVYHITLVDNDANSYISFVEQNTSYPVTIPVGATYYTITASKINGSYATMYITTENGNILSTNGNYTENISVNNWGKSITYYVYAMAQDTETGKGTQFEIKVTIEKPSDDDDLISLKVDGQELISETNPVGPYTLGVPFETSSVHIYAETSHENATIKVGTSKVSNIYSGNADLKVGVNLITVEVCAEDLVTYTQYIIEITRAAEAPKLDTLEVNGTYLRDEFSNRVAFDPETYHYYVIVPFEKNEVEIMATSTMGEVFGTGTKSINVGTQDFAVQVVALNGMATSYTVTVMRLLESYSNSYAEYIRIKEIQEFNEAFKPTKTFGYEYTVPNNVTDLTVTVKLQFEDDNVNDDLDAKYEVYGDTDLRVGLNNVVVIVTSADGTNQTTYLIQVIREPKQYDVNNKDEAVKDFALEQKKNESGEAIENEYVVDIGKKKTSEVNFTKFIEDLNPDNQKLDIEVITDISTNPNEVVVRISDGDEIEFVKFQVKSEGNPTGMEGGEWIFLLLLGIILVILTAILIAVNKDKYGKITKKTNKKSEKKENKEEAKRK